MAQDITADLVRRLLTEQLPEWADLPLRPVARPGWDNTTFRLGESMSVRLPNGDAYAAQVPKEQERLPVLGPQLPLPIPQPLALGRPGMGFDRPWSVYRWIPGTPVGVSDSQDRLATGLAGFLAALQRVDSPGGPPAGAHSFGRGGPLGHLTHEVHEAVRRLHGPTEVAHVADVWQGILEHEYSGAPVWVHGDVAGSNLLTTNGQLAAVLDFGCCAVGDPACDLSIAWTLFSDGSRQRFRSGLDLDAGTWERGRGWALWKALLVLVDEQSGDDSGWRRMGWRTPAAELVKELLA